MSAVVVALAALLPANGLGAVPFHGVSGDAGKGIVIAAAACYAEVPPAGATPVVFRIENRTPVDRVWHVEAKSTSDYSDQNVMTQTWTIEVPATGTVERQLLVPIPPSTASNNSSWRSVNLTIEGYGVLGSNGYVSSRSPAIGDLRRTVLVGPTFAVHKERVQRIDNQEVHYLGGQVGCLPLDVKGYLGIDSVILGTVELEAMPFAALAVLEEHIFVGGQLVVLAPSDSEATLPLSFTDSLESKTYGLGRLDVVRVPESGAFPIDTVEWALSRGPTRYADLHHDGEIAKAYPKIEVRRGTMLVLLILFAIVIGPINVFVFARRRHRGRLVWTTPVLSVGASFLLASAILIEDGVGGHGVRYAMTILNPDHHASHTLQVQASRTGLMLFPRLDASKETHLDYLPTSVEQGGRYEVTNEGPRGDWFRTRRTQGHWLHSRQPSRARVEVVGRGQGPVIVSSIDTALATLFYVDEELTFWRVDNVAPGAKTTLEASSADAFHAFRESLLHGSHPILYDRATARAGWFYASATDPSAAILPTLESLKWSDKGSVYLGPVVAGGQP